MTTTDNFRYRVTSIRGTVPPDIVRIKDQPDAYLVYPEYRGKLSTQGFVSDGALVGEWDMIYAGKRRIENK